jgi:alkylmercury lyase
MSDPATPNGDPSTTGGNSDVAWLGLPLLRLLANGEPVALTALAQATGRPLAEVRHALAGHRDIEYNQHGHITGNGITLNPTPHRFQIDGRPVYTWCALDTLVFPGMLGITARVESSCHGTGIPIHLTVHPDRVTDLQPATAVVSIITPTDTTTIRTSFCNQVHFFASPHAARTWLTAHPGGQVVPVAEAQHQYRALIEGLPLAGHCGCC